MATKISSITGIEPQAEIAKSYNNPPDEVVDDLQKINARRWDPNLPQENIDAIEASKSEDQEKAAEVDKPVLDDSPYESVRAAVRNTDNGEVANTVRAWVLGMIFVTLGSGLNMFLSMRNPAISFPAIVVQLLVYPFGCLWARVMPTRVFHTCGVRWTLNTGPFTIKEHTVITCVHWLCIQHRCLAGSQSKTQLIGISLAGMFRRFLVWPAAMIWPGMFSNSSLFYALHDKSMSDASQTNGWKISRYRYFLYVMVGAFAWYWIPAVIWQGLSVFAFITWIKPNNVVLNQLFGGYTGLSLIPITFDWTYVSAYLMDPLLAPWHAHLNTLIGLIVFVILSIIGITYTGALYSDYLPMNTPTTYDNRQKPYDVSRILGPGFTFDEQKYKHYSPMFLAPSFALNYGLSFAGLTAALVHIILFHHKEIWYRFRAARDQEPDVHLQLMKKYREAPDWWYAALFLVSVAFGLAGVLGYDSQLPWWAFFVSIIIAIIPTCMILAITNVTLSLNVLSPFLAGFIIPGRPIGVMVFKVFSTITLGQAQYYCQDLKLAHYMKVPPRVVFTCQVAATIWAAFVQIAVMNWTLGNIDQVCMPIVWGVIGPNRMFGPGGLYTSIQWFWLVGALLPVVFYLAVRVWPRSPIRFLNAPVMLGAMSWLPPATPLSFSTWAIFGLLFNYWIRRRWSGWWHTYNYITAAGLDSGLVLSTIVIFFAITLPGVSIPKWWGNTAPYLTMDSQATAYKKKVGEGGKFGPDEW
ncbi:hypothetical protein EYZ11_007299 [Aspergillus tanneri]|uniref:OPT family small oligopeptide transporter n=1 Tax=Aspergillus tanneri TaxID=1220188 RepID=A0A4S3JFK8_9EURO|nr:hypothetical protein EYZ11_007299 [Aspergillus tanneri]